MGTEKIREQRIQGLMKIMRLAKKQDKDVDKEKLIASLCLQWFISRRKALEYIKTLVEGGFLNEDLGPDGGTSIEFIREIPKGIEDEV